ncbi:unnamed protein product [Sphagnum jensenii]|uniref:Laccase n=1 Tax=Sphagnum jensenii TaxID=128206 RepID=A0ABP1A2A7_9BRYO
MEGVCVSMSQLFLLLLLLGTIVDERALVFGVRTDHGLRYREAETRTKKFDFEVKYTTVVRLCNATSIVTVNDQFPGPTIRVKEGDRVIVTVRNHVDYNITIHWHGVNQRLSAWNDGPAYITQCPIQPNQSYTYNFTVEGQAGTVWWHAHITWLRATLHGAFIIEPNRHNLYPYQHILKGKIFKDEVVLLGDFWTQNVEEIYTAVVETGAINVANPYIYASAINGQPGPLYPCSEAGTYRLKVKRGKTYLLRIINVSLLDEFLFAIADHTMTVVEVDGAYTKPYSTSVVLISPGQSMNVWVTADQPANRSYTILSASYIPNLLIATHRLNATGVFEYEGSSWTFNPPATSPTAPCDSNTSRHHHQLQPLVTPSSFPAQNDSNFVDMFISQIKGIGADPKGSKSSNRVPLPLEIDRNLFFLLSTNALPCPSCTGGNIPGFRNAAAINNISFVLPTSTAILPAYYYSNKQNYADKDLQQHVYTTDFPDFPPLVYNYTGMPKNPLQYADANKGTKVSVLEYGSRVQIVLQSSSTIVGPETHPIHLHGQSFYVVATGLGNFDEASNVQMNLVDPPLRNTVVVPSGGWTVIRFVANNPGVWFLHCHLELHITWGMEMVFIVKDGKGPQQTLPPPPADYPKC